MDSLTQGFCVNSPQDLLEPLGEAIAAMTEVISEKLYLFGSVDKAHLHQSPYAEMLALS